MDHRRTSQRSSEPDLRILATLAWLEKRALWAVVLVAGAVLALWFLPPVAAFAPAGWSRMTANAAAGLLLASASLVLSAHRGSSVAYRLSRVAAFAVLALGCLTLVEYGGLSLGIDHWLPTNAAATYPGRPSPQTALGFVLAGVCLVLAQSSGNRLSQCADFCALGFMALDFVLLGGYVFQAIELVGIDTSNLTSPQTLFCLVSLAFVIVTRRASRGGFFAFWIDRGSGSRIARMALPAIVAFPFLTFSLVEIFEKSGLLGRHYTRAIAAPVLVVGGMIVVGWMGRRTNDSERELRWQSLTDQLTDVLNRRGFYAVADYAIRNARRLGTGLVLFYFDLDGLKAINDRHGHEAGSTAIKRFAEVLVATFRKNDVIGRIGGDEFVVLAADTTGTATAILARLAITVAESNDARAGHATLSYSAGYADSPPLMEVKIDDLISQADAMMYDQKVRKSAQRPRLAATPRASAAREAQTRPTT